MASASRPARVRPTQILFRVLFTTLAVCAIAVAAGFVYLRLIRTRAEPLAGAELGIGARQRAALETYLAREQLGTFLPPGDAVIAIREAFLQNVLDRSLPWRQSFDDGHYVVDLDRARVRLESGVALVTLAGRGMRGGGDERTAPHVELIVHGHIAIAGVDPDSGRLAAGLVVTDVSEPGMRPEDIQNLVNPVARYFGRLRAEDWNRNRRHIEIPIRIERELVLPELTGKVALPESRVPLAVQVSAVTTLDRRLAVSLALHPDSASGEPPGEPPDPRWNSELVSPNATPLDSLRARVARLAARDPLWQSVTASDHDLVVLVPEPLLRTLTARVAHRYLHGVEVDVHPSSVVRFQKRVRASIFGTKHAVAHFEGAIRFGNLHAVLALAGKPQIELVPPDGLAISMPARVLRGRGSVNLDVKWAPAKLLALLCPPFHLQQTVSGDILPFADTLRTGIRWEIQDSTVVGRPHVRRDVLSVPVDLTDSSWARVRVLLAEQDKPGRCGLLMDADDALKHLRTLAANGVKIRLSSHLFKPFRLPVVLEEHYATDTWRIEAHTYDPAIEVRTDHLRIAFRAALRVAGPDTTGVAARTGAATRPSLSRGRGS